LNCEEVYRFVIFKNNDGTTDSTERIIRSFSLGEPAAQLFDTANLTERSPITAFLMQYRKIGWPEDQLQQRASEMATEEAQYFAQ
jgi:hypothetical protein